MATETTASFTDVRRDFTAYVADIKYATMITVDARNRPRARVLLPVWEFGDDGTPLGWLAAFRTPIKAAHLAGNPHTTYSYWSPRQNAVFVDAVSTWVEDPETKRHAWERYVEGGPPGVGYDPSRYWPDGPDAPGFDVIRIEPWRIQLVRGTDLHNTIWRPEG